MANAYNTLSEHAARKAANPNYFANAPRNLQIAWREGLDQATSELYANAQARSAMSPAEEAIYLDFMMGGYTVADSDDWLDQSLSNAVAVINRHVAWREADAAYYYTASYDERFQWFTDLRDAVGLITSESAECMLTDLANDLVSDFASVYMPPEHEFACQVRGDILNGNVTSYDNGIKLVAINSPDGVALAYYLENNKGVKSKLLSRQSSELANRINQLFFSAKFIDIVNKFVKYNVAEATNG